MLIHVRMAGDSYGVILLTEWGELQISLDMATTSDATAIGEIRTEFTRNIDGAGTAGN
jgi:hypothetical protein